VGEELGVRGALMHLDASPKLRDNHRNVLDMALDRPAGGSSFTRPVANVTEGGFP